MRPFTAVAVSGGVDSLHAAFHLKQKGYKVVGIHFIHGFETSSKRSPSSKIVSTYCQEYPHEAIHEIGRQIDIPIEVLDLTDVFKDTVVKYFVDAYDSGQTPNPCMVCNPHIKFGTLLAFAKELGAARLATGHYARTEIERNGRVHLLRGTDRKKDQSYFLAFLKPDQLAVARFPNGGMTKTEVKRRAADNHLQPITQGESQDVCFIRNETYGAFLSDQKDFEAKPGLIEDVQGNIIGKHQGLHLFTVGQRRGINCPGPRPYYVIRLDRSTHRLIVGGKENLLSAKCRVAGINWITCPPTDAVAVEVRVRYRSPAVPAMVFPESKKEATVRFDVPQSAVTPGQAAVFYKGEEVLGGGWIKPGSDAL